MFPVRGGHWRVLLWLNSSWKPVTWLEEIYTYSHYLKFFRFQIFSSPLDFPIFSSINSVFNVPFRFFIWKHNHFCHSIKVMWTFLKLCLPRGKDHCPRKKSSKITNTHITKAKNSWERSKKEFSREPSFLIGKGQLLLLLRLFFFLLQKYARKRKSKTLLLPLR